MINDANDSSDDSSDDSDMEELVDAAYRTITTHREPEIKIPSLSPALNVRISPVKQQQKYNMSSRIDTGMEIQDSLQKISQPVVARPVKELVGIEKLHNLTTQQSLRQLKKQRKEERAKTKGGGWFSIPASEMTDEKKNDLQVIRMRKALFPKQFYKGPDLRAALPKYFQTGTIVENAADFYSSRIPKKLRKKTLVDELLADSEFRTYNKKKYSELQSHRQQNRRYKTKGKK